MRRIARSILPLGLAVGVVSLGGSASAMRGQTGPSCSGIWTVQPSPNAGDADSLSGVAAVSPTDVWAVGTDTVGPNQFPLFEHFDGATWSVVAPRQATSPRGSLSGVSARITSDVWAVGTAFRTNPETLVEHWDGARWRVIPSPNPGPLTSQLFAVSALAADDVWAVGAFINPADGNFDTLTEHWDGQSWTAIPSPSPSQIGQNSLNGVAAVSSTDVWAVGNIGTPGGNGATLIEHWDGQAWSVVQGAPTGPLSGLSGTAAVSSSYVWAIGTDSDQQFNIHPLAERWDGTSWQIVQSPQVGASAALYGVAASSSTSAWAVGQRPGTVTSSASATLIEGWDGADWIIAPSPSPGNTGNLLVSTSELTSGPSWAVGDFTNADGIAHTLIEANC